MALFKRRIVGLFALSAVAAASGALAAGTPLPPAENLVLLSAPDDPLLFGTAGSERSDECAIDGDGSHLVFASAAPQLVAGDTNGSKDVFIRDVGSGLLERLNQFASGQQNPNGASGVSITGNGRFVAFNSQDNLLTNTAGGPQKTFVLDRQTGAMLLASQRSDGQPGNGSSGDARLARGGRYVVFSSSASDLVASDGNAKSDIFRFDAQTQTVVRASADAGGIEANDHSYQSGVSNNGQFVAFESDADNLVPGDTNGKRDVFVKDLDSGAIERISVSSAGVEGNEGSDFLDISTDGDIVLFQSRANNLVAGDTGLGYDLFVRRRGAGTTERVSVDAMGNQISGVGEGRLTSDGGFLVFESSDPALDGPTNNQVQVYVKSLNSGAVNQITDLMFGSALRSRISGNGAMVCFETNADDAAPGDSNGQYDVVAVETATEIATLASAAPAAVPVTGGLRSTIETDISADGRYAVFSSESVLDSATYAAHGDDEQWHVYLRDAESSSIVLVSADDLGVPGDDWSGLPRISGDGRYVVYQSSATNLGPTPGALPNDIYRWDSHTDATELLSVDELGMAAGGRLPDIDGDGDRVVFHSDTLVLPGDGNGDFDVFLWEAGVGVSALSVAANGDFGNRESTDASISADGRHVVFMSRANTLLPDMSIYREVLLRDLQDGTLRVVSSPPGITPDADAQGVPSVSGDGMRIAFRSSASNLVAVDPNGNDTDLFIYDRADDSVLRVPVERVLMPGIDYYAALPTISDDGSHVLTWMIDGDLAGGGDLLLRYDIAHDRVVVLTGRLGNGYPNDSWPQAARPSADASLIAFVTPDPLVNEDVNGDDRADAYRLYARPLADAIFTDGFEPVPVSIAPLQSDDHP